MNSSLIRNISITIVLALAGYFLYTPLSSIISPDASLALGIIIGGLIITILNNTSSTQPEEKTTKNTTTLYIGNLAYRVNESAVRQHFAKVGDVRSVRLMQDKRTGKKKGFGFVEVNSDDADKMIKSYNDTEFFDRTLKVRLAKERKAD